MIGFREDQDYQYRHNSRSSPSQLFKKHIQVADGNSTGRICILTPSQDAEML